MQRGFENYDYLDYEDIVEACLGDQEALSKVFKRYECYEMKCLKNMARHRGFDMNSLPIDDLKQEVWTRLISLIQEDFET